jgi:hypothetical protein
MMITSEEIAILGSLRNEVKRLEYEIEQIAKIESGAAQTGYNGKPIPCREGIEIDLPGDLTRRSGTFVISADGPFVATGMHFAFKWNDVSHDTPPIPINGYWRPTSIPQFYFEYQVSGTQRVRQKVRVPSYNARRAEIGNGYLPLTPHDVFAKTSTVTIYITPISNASVFSDSPYTGELEHAKMWVGFNGFYLLDQ